MLGNSNFLSKLSNVDIDKIPTDVALRVKDNIAGLSEDVCRKINQAIVGCFLWVNVFEYTIMLVCHCLNGYNFYDSLRVFSPLYETFLKQDLLFQKKILLKKQI